MSVTHVAEARHALLRAAIHILDAEYGLAAEHVDSRRQVKADDDLFMASRTLAEAVDRLPAGRRPKGWDAQPERATA